VEMSNSSSSSSTTSSSGTAGVMPSVKVPGTGENAVKSDINVTPLVDVCLVLLIIFMVVTPMLQKGVDVALPETARPEKMPEGPSS